MIFKSSNENISGQFDRNIPDQQIISHAVNLVFEKLSLGLSILDKETLNREIIQHLDRGKLYIRFDKQSAYLNQLKLSQRDAIHFRIHFKKRSTEEIVDICRKFGLLS